MALLIGGRFKVTTAAGVAVSGGYLRLYSAGTTTLATVYSDSALSVPLANPVPAGSDGWTPQIFAAEGTTVDGDFLTAGSLVIAGQSFVNAVFVSASGTTFTRDFTNSRVQIRGAGGVVYFEAGDPTGDDVGGNWRMGGWGGSQAVTGYLDAATIDTSGVLTMGTKSLPGVVTTGATTFTSVASVNIPLTAPLTGIAGWDIDVWDLQHATNATALKATLSFDGAGSFKTGAGDYRSGVLAGGNGAVAYVGGVADTYIHVTDSITVKSGVSGRIRMSLLGPSATASLVHVMGEYATAYQADSSTALFQFASSCTGSYGTPTHIQLVSSSGNISGKYRVVGRFGHV